MDECMNEGVRGEVGRVSSSGECVTHCTLHEGHGLQLPTCTLVHEASCGPEDDAYT
jgi:hypothetical protein